MLLNSVTLPAYRAAVKTALDHILIHGDPVVTNTDLEESLKDIGKSNFKCKILLQVQKEMQRGYIFANL